VRVASRRIDAWLWLGRRRALRDDLRWLRQGLGPLRDRDVLKAEGRDEALAGARKLVGGERATALVRALSHLTAGPDADRAAILAKRLGRTPPPATLFEAHALRRRVRRLR